MTKHKKLPVLASRAVVLFFSLLLLSESTVASVGSYGLKIAQQPATTSQDATRAEAERLTQEGWQLFQQGTAESLRQAIVKWQEALKLWQKVGDKQWQANILLGLGRIYSDLGEKEQGLKFLNQSLPLMREVRDTAGEATTLNNIGKVYSDLGEKQQALKFYNQSLPLTRKLGDKAQEATTLNNIGKVYSDLGEKQQALKFLNQSLLLRRKVGDKAGEASTLNNIGAVYFSLGDKQQALKFFNQCLTLMREVRDKAGEAITLNNIGEVYSSLGDKQQALKFFNQSLPLAKEVGNKAGVATTLNNIGAVYSDLGEKEQALKFFNQSLLLRREVGDKAGVATTLNNIGEVYSSLGEKQQALKFFNQSLPLAREVRNQAGVATTLSNIGKVYSLLGEKQQALNFYNQSLPLAREVGDKAQEANTLNSIGVVYDDLGEKQQALNFYNQSLPLAREVGDKAQEAAILNNIGLLYSDLGEQKQALKFFNQCLTLTREVRNKAQEATTLNNIAGVYFSLGEKQQALKFLNQSLPLKREVGDKAGVATTLNNIGKVYSSLGEKQQALKFFNSSLPLMREVEYKTGEATTLWNIADLERKAGNFQAALRKIDSAIQIIEDLRKTYTNKDLQSTYFATVQDYYKFKIDLLMELHKKDPSKGYNAQAIETSEASRARGLVELLTEAHANIRKGANPELLAEERRIQALIDGKEKVRFEIVNSNKIQDPIYKANAEKLQAEIDELLRQQKELETKIRQTSPQYANLKYPQPLNLSQIQQQLDKDTLLLQYSLGSDRSFLWVVSPNSLDTYELPKKQEIEKSAINLFCLISQHISKPPSVTNKENPCTGIKNRKIDVAATELSQLILSPVKGKLGTKRLVIVADGALQYIPFAALADLNSQPTSTPPQENEKPKETSCSGAGGIRVCSPAQPQSLNYQPLLVNHEIVSLPSASTIAIQRQQLANRPQAPQALAILADPVYNATDTRVTTAQNKQLQKQDSLDLELERSALKRSADSLNRQGWTRLLGTRTEAETIFNLVPNAKNLQLLDFAANYTAATSNNLNQFRILHFATHGFVNDANPELSGLVLSLVDKQGKDIRGYLRLADLFNLDYPADLIVLSACETGLGKEIQGEGLVGLTRGLMYAGAERLVVSLWQVDDKGTAEFMQEFYKQMWQQNKSANQALRAAQLKMWQQEKWRNPNYWAAFTFLGEWR
ncbi:CHAT domain-containing protein [Tolypothrix sp. FACHB-123]|uniref:CHAT domain-containing tetratricopeptide repeat protein n=1 Tax=Tolypothrix sp. FACHB-123 TaxID=2692868 RepID=UPI0016895B74|nr:CHAT domain-containing tetratricopeptide repeat protein [Tolypothrix sp. FACHB-123]MBD2354273.1 CHAT domain-containing protein [Tolypothrix sp. FACHB-123]